MGRSKELARVAENGRLAEEGIDTMIDHLSAIRDDPRPLCEIYKEQGLCMNCGFQKSSPSVKCPSCGYED